jgi:protease-4
VVAFFLTGCVNVNVSLFEKTKPLQEKVLSGEGKNKILLVNISGVISSKESSSLFREGTSTVSRVREELKKAGADKRIKGLVLRINSPGGTVTASDIIYREIKEFKEDKQVPIVACMMDVTASGAYFVALVSDVIIAHPTSLTGSIGVIALKFNVKGLLEKLNIEEQTIKSGDKKDLWSPFRPCTEEEIRIIQGIIDGFHEKFIQVIAEGRPELNTEKIRSLADGRIYTAEQAVDLKLIDKVGYLNDAIEIAKKEAGITEARVVSYHRPSDYKNNIYSMFNTDPSALVESAGLTFMYLWAP